MSGEALERVDAADLDDVIARVKAAAFDEGSRCTHCDGDGRVMDGSNLIVHSRGSFIGADWGMQGVIDAVRSSDQVMWGDGGGHDLAVRLDDGRWMKFQVPHPDRPVDDEAVA